MTLDILHVHLDGHFFNIYRYESVMHVNYACIHVNYTCVLIIYAYLFMKWMDLSTG